MLIIKYTRNFSTSVMPHAGAAEVPGHDAGTPADHDPGLVSLRVVAIPIVPSLQFLQPTLESSGPSKRLSTLTSRLPFSMAPRVLGNGV